MIYPYNFLANQLDLLLRRAGELLLKIRTQTTAVASNKDLVTTADLVSEKFILEQLAALTPEIPVYSEEAGGGTTQEKPQWIVDPLDGTINYSLGDNLWGISVALTDKGQTLLGGVYLPEINFLKITTIKDSKLPAITSSEAIEKGRLWVDWSKDAEANQKMIQIIQRPDVLSLYPQIRLCCSASMMMVAMGKISAYLHPSPTIEDQAAAGLIVERAGGVVSDWRGNLWTPFSKDLVAAVNSTIHKKVLELIR